MNPMNFKLFDLKLRITWLNQFWWEVTFNIGMNRSSRLFWLDVSMLGYGVSLEIWGHHYP